MIRVNSEKSGIQGPMVRVWSPGALVLLDSTSLVLLRVFPPRGAGGDRAVIKPGAYGIWMSLQAESVRIELNCRTLLISENHLLVWGKVSIPPPTHTHTHTPYFW